MAYRQLFTGIKQTAYNVAGSVVAAEIAAGLLKANEVQARLLEIADLLFEDLSQVVESDNKILEAEDAKDASTSKPRSSGNWGGGKNRSYGGGGGSNRSVTAESARDTTLNFGAFKGLTLGEVFDMSADDAAAYGYGDGKKTGKQYVTWLSKNEDNKFMQDRARVLIEGARSQSDAA